MGLTNVDYGAQIPPDMAFLYFFCAAVITFALLGLLILIARSNAQGENTCCIEGHC